MAVLLEDLVDSLKREISPPGTDLFPDATEADYVGYLSDSLYELMLAGVVTGYRSDGELITPTSGNADLSRELQQVLVLFAGIRIITNDLRNRNSLFRAKAGPVEYETQQGASTMKEILAELNRRRAWILYRLADTSSVDTEYIDMVTARTNSILTNELPYVTGVH